MAWVEINPDFKRVIKVLDRIAHALEMHLQFAYGYRLSPPSKAELEEEQAGEPGDVQYATDEDTMRQEAESARREIEQTDDAGLVK
jgi:hypothetical protein